MKVWILIENGYEWNDVLKVFDTEEKAEKERSYYSKDADLSIDEFEVE